MIKSVMVDGAEALKLMVDGSVAWERSGLPAGYRRCKYLGSSETQWIETQIIPVFGDVIQLRAQRIDQNAPLFYAGNNNQLTVLASKFGYDRGVSYTKYFQGDTDAISFPLQNFDIDGVFHDFDFGPNGLFVDGSKVCGISDNRKSADSHLCLFRANTVFGSIHMASFSMSRNGITLLQFVPALDQSGVPCMYDMVSKKPFYNQGTGEFLYELS